MTQSDLNAVSTLRAGYLIAIGFWIVAVVLFFGGSGVDLPVVESGAAVPASEIRTGAHRVALGDPPVMTNGAVTQRCNDCHTLFEAEREPGRELVQHTDIQLRHGSNDSCLNCHDQGDREKLSIRNGDPVGFADVAQLCAECHGPVYRDWLKGAHGKTLGAWDPTNAASVRLTCSQCHDPHNPAYAPMAPLPGPNTLRMGDPNANPHAGLIHSKSPLQRWRSNEHQDEHGEDH